MKGRLPQVVILLNSSDPSFGHHRPGNDIATSTKGKTYFPSRKVIGTDVPANLDSDRGQA